MEIRLMIIDDDIQIQEGIRCGIDWKSIDVQEVRSYGDGCSALADFSAFKPQIILTDIRMPGMDGITFLQEVQKKDSSVKVILISAYSDFEYCQKAIEFGAVGYELKPLKVRKLIQTIQEIVKSIQIEEKGKELYDIYRETYKERLTSELLEGKILDRNVIMEILKQYFGLENAETLICMVIEADTAEKTKNLFEINEILPPNSRMVALFYKNQIVIFVKTTNSMLYVLEKQNELKSIWYQILGKLKEKNITVSAGISGLVEVKDLYKGYEQAVLLLKERFWNGISFIGVAGFSPKGKKNSLRETPISWQKAMQKLSMESIETALEELEEYFKEYHIEKEELENLILEYCNALCQKIGMSEKKILQNFQQQLKQCSFLHDEMKYWKLFCYSMLEKYEDNQNQKYSMNIRCALDYIHQHYMDDIGVEEVSDFIGKTPNYFSSIFKSETGMAFREYLNRFRIKQAVELLEKSDMMIYEVAEKVGYKDYTYFSQVFKKITGTSPTSLRRKG